MNLCYLFQYDLIDFLPYPDQKTCLFLFIYSHLCTVAENTTSNSEHATVPVIFSVMSFIKCSRNCSVCSKSTRHELQHVPDGWLALKALLLRHSVSSAVFGLLGMCFWLPLTHTTHPWCPTLPVLFLMPLPLPVV